MKYEIAIQEQSYVQTPIIHATNCTDKIKGHQFRCATILESIEIRKHIKMKFGIYVCCRCGKLTQGH